MPADITGTEILEEAGDGRRRMQFVKGPIFANVILADEINRTPPKTQAALLEAMQEHQVTAAGVRYPLEEPFFVLATQNPIEMEGTYPLPEAQLDRFMFNVIDRLPARGRRGRGRAADDVAADAADRAAVDGEDVLAVPRGRARRCRSPRTWSATPCGWRRRAGRANSDAGVHQRACARGGRDRGRRNISSSVRRPAPYWKAGAHVTVDDIRRLAGPVLRHRILMNYRAEAEGVTVEQIIDRD